MNTYILIGLVLIGGIIGLAQIVIFWLYFATGFSYFSRMCDLIDGVEDDLPQLIIQSKINYQEQLKRHEEIINVLKAIAIK